MLLKKQTLEGIIAGRIKYAFRKWTKPTVKAGGRLHTFMGVLAINNVVEVTERKITSSDAKQAGFENKKKLLDELHRRSEGKLYRITLKYEGRDPRIELRENARITRQEVQTIKTKLARMDIRSAYGAWTEKGLDRNFIKPW